MAVKAASIWHPEGELNQSMFPDEDVKSLAIAWFNDANSRVASLADGDTKDAAVKAWVYHRAYTTVANAIASRPTSSDYYNQRQETWGADRIKYFSEKAKLYLDQYNMIMTPTVTSSAIGFSTYAKRQAVW